MSFDGLTESQHAAVEHFEGPLLVVAGPGSGKTRVITRRIARLVDRGVHPEEILAITFTNKASRVMSERIESLLPRSRVWVSTFHKFCVRMLRKYGSAIGLSPSFSILDVGDQVSMMKQVLHEHDLDTTHFPPGKVLGRIGKAKNDLVTASEYQRRHSETIGTHLDAVVARIYPAYQRRLLDANSVDFDDLLVHFATLLRENDELRRSLDERFRFILVDEYQDTNRAQYEIVAALSQYERNLCVTGDPDQSIYGWRGARIENILRFEQDFPGVRLIRLEENFRSTPEILAVADNLIQYNTRRKQKHLRPTRASGEPVEMRVYTDGQHEAQSIAADIQAQVRAEERSWGDFAIFYRVNALSRSIETALSRLKVPYQVAGGLAFYERAEIKDVLAYLRLVENSRDRIAFLRVVNTPTRGIGKTSLERLVQWADGAGVDLLEAARHAERVPDLPKKAAVGLRAFAAMIDEFIALSANPYGDDASLTEFQFDVDDQSTAAAALRGPVETIVRAVLDRTGYLRQFEGSLSEDEVQRRSNVDELVSSAALFDQQAANQEELSTLGAFLETASLTQDIDTLDDRSGAVTLMTLHSAKGLEYPCVYLVGVEQNLIPHERSIRENDSSALEEERRLLFVGLTRAEDKLILTRTERREMHGRTLSTIPSDFLRELNLRPVQQSTEDVESFQPPAEFEPDSASDNEWSGDRHRTGSRSFGGRQSMPRRERKVTKPHLTTGAALEAGSGKTVDLPVGFSLGMQVRHPRYGVGTVVDVSGFSRRRTVTVEFSTDNRRESFVAEKCPLQPIGFS